MKAWQIKAKKVLAPIAMKMNVSMRELTTFKIGGPLDLLVEPADLSGLQRVIEFCKEEKLPWMVIGYGSNLLVRDKGIRGVGIKLTGYFTFWDIKETEVTAGAGMSLAEVVKKTACYGLTGMEFACGIPGTVGGAVYMNAGAYDGEMARILQKVLAFDPETASVNWYSKDDLNLGYRLSRFQLDSQIILKMVLQLERAAKESVQARITELTCQRESKQPLEMPSAGSVFRRPPGHFVGPLIEQAGLKGYSIGGARISTKHAGFIVNKGGATARDVLALIQHVQNVINEKFGVELIPEVKVIGEE